MFHPCDVRNKLLYLREDMKSTWSAQTTKRDSGNVNFKTRAIDDKIFNPGLFQATRISYPNSNDRQSIIQYNTHKHGESIMSNTIPEDNSRTEAIINKYFVYDDDNDQEPIKDTKSDEAAKPRQRRSKCRPQKFFEPTNSLPRNIKWIYED